MAVCKFFQQGTCRNGSNCNYEHISPGAFGRGGAAVATNKYNETSIKTNLTEERPQWRLSVYGPAKEEPNLIVGTDRSPEEDRLSYYLSMRQAGNESQYINGTEQLSNQMEGQVNAILNSTTAAVQHYEKEKSKQSGPFSKNTSNAPFTPFTGSSGGGFGQTSAFGGGANAFGSGGATAFGGGGTSAFGQPSAFGAAKTTSAFGSTSTLGGSGSAFGSTSALGSSGSAFGSTSALGNTGSAFGSTNALGGGSAFGSTSALGGSGSAFGSTSALGGGSAFGSTSALGSGGGAFGQSSAFGAKPATSAPAFGSASTMGSAFGSTSALGGGGAFGTTSSNTNSAFGSTSTLGNNNTTSAFGSTSALGNNSTPAFGNTGGAFGTAGTATPAFGATTNNNVPNTMATGAGADGGSGSDWEAFSAPQFTYRAIPEIEPPAQLR